MNCGAALGGPYCAACGQRSRDGRITVRHVAAQVAGELSPVDRGIVFTFLGVLRRPGVVARDYVEGRTVRYVGPVKYFLLLGGAAQILSLRVGVLGELVSGLFEGITRGTTDPGVAQSAVMDFAARYFVSLSAVGVPVFAAWTRALFRRARLNYAEHVVLALYTGAQQIVLFTLVAWLSVATHLRGLDWVYFAAALAYQTGALRQFTGVSRAQSAARTIAAALLAIICLTAALGIVFHVLGRRA